MSFSAYAGAFFAGNVALAENVGLSMAFIIHTSQFLMMIAVGIICYFAILPKLKIGGDKPEQAVEQPKEMAAANE